MLESMTIEGDSPVGEIQGGAWVFLSSTGYVRSRVNLPEPSGKAKYSLMTDSAQVP